MSQKFLFVRKVAGRAGAGGQNTNILTQNQSCFCKPFSQKQLTYDFLAGNNHPDSPHSQGGLPHKFHLFLIDS